MNDRGGFDSRRRSFVPVKVGDEFDVTVEAVGEKGDGIAKKEGFVLFIPNTKQGDNVRIKVTRVLRRVGFAEVVGSAGASAQPKREPTEEGDSEPPADEEQDSDEEPVQEDEVTEAGESEDSEDFGEEEKQ